MKKNFIKVKDFANLAKIKKQINDTLTGDKSAELKQALTDLISELDSSEVEVDEKAFADQVADAAAPISPWRSCIRSIPSRMIEVM